MNEIFIAKLQTNNYYSDTYIDENPKFDCKKNVIETKENETTYNNRFFI